MPLHIPSVVAPPPAVAPTITNPGFRIRFLAGTLVQPIGTVLSLSSQIGRTSSRTDGTATGSGSLQAVDKGRLLDPDNTGSPLYGKLDPAGTTTVVVDCLIPGFGYQPVYTGALSDEITSWPGGTSRSEVQITLADSQLDLTQHIPVAGRVYPQKQTGARILELLGAPSRSGWGWLNRAPSGLMAIEAGSKVLAALTADGSATTWEYVAQAAAAEEGLVFFDQAGVPTFQGRQHRLGQSTPKWVFGDGPGEVAYEPSLQLRLSNDRSLADVAYQTGDGVVSVYGPNGATTMTQGGTASPLADQYSGAARARSEYGRFSVNRRDAPTVEINALGEWPATGPGSRFWCALTAQIGDLVTLKRRPGGGPDIVRNYFIDAIAHTYSVGTWSTVFTLVFADAANTGWRLGTDFLGALAPNPIRLNW